MVRPSTRVANFRSAASGFTLMELIIGIAIVAVIVSAAMPTMLDWMRQRGVRDAADQLAMDLQRAKLLAIKHNTNCTITINSPGPDQYTISIINEVVDLRRFAGAVKFTNSPDPSATWVTFTPHSVCQDFGSFFLSDQNRRFRVRVSAAGGISVHLNSGGQWI
jgi:type IV fimbrial biogenesis protein FimT